MPTKSKAEVSKVVIKIGDAEHALTLEQAKELCEALGQLFDKPAPVVVQEHHHHSHPYRYWHFDAVPYGTYTADNTNPSGVYTLSLANTQ